VRDDDRLVSSEMVSNQPADLVNGELRASGEPALGAFDYSEVLRRRR
jgi:hypothetical protein